MLDLKIQFIFQPYEFLNIIPPIPISVEQKEQEVKLIPIDEHLIRISFKESLPMQIFIKNIGIHSLPPLDIFFRLNRNSEQSGNSYFLDERTDIKRSIEPGNWEVIPVTFRYGGAPFSVIPDEISFKVYDSLTRKEIYCSQNSFLLSSGLFISFLILYI